MLNNHRLLVRLAAGLAALVAEPVVDPAQVAAESAPKLVIDTQGFTSPVNSLDFSPRGDRLAVGGSDKVVRVWEVATGRLVHTLRGYDDDAGNGQCQAVRFSPDGRSLVVGVQDFSSAGALRVYDTGDFGEIQALLAGHGTGGVIRMEFSRDGRYLASEGADGGIIFWDWPARRQIGHVPWTTNLAYFGFPTALPILVAFDAQGFHAISAPHAREVARLTPAERAALGRPDQISGALATAAGLMASFGRVEGQLPYKGQSNINRLAPVGDGLILFGGSAKKDGADAYWVGLWAASGRPIRVYDGHSFTPTALAVRADGDLVASADSLGNVDLWEAQTGRRRLRLSGKGQSVYNVAYDASGTRLLFGTEPYGPGVWAFNNYAALDRSFDLRKRTLLNVGRAAHEAPSRRRADRELRLANDRHDQSYSVMSFRRGQVEGMFPLSPGVVPLCYGYLSGSRTGVGDLLTVGCQDNTLTGMDPADVFRSRAFIGHTGAVNAFGNSPDGRFLVSGSADRTLRVWSLAPLVDDGWPDFFANSSGLVYFVKPGGSSERAGIRLGDTMVGLGGRDLGTVFDRKLAGFRDYLPGQRSVVDMSRGGQPYQAKVDLIPSGDLAIPLLSLFVVGDEWVVWTPSGYYDASPGGDRLIGWHVNRGRARAARFYIAHQFRKQFFRPDVIDKILETGDTKRGVELANRERAQESLPLDLRKAGDLRKVEPPRVTLREPREGTRTRGRSVTVRASVESQNGQPIGDIKVMLNGRSVTGKNLPGRGGDTETARTVEAEIELEPGRNTVSVLATDRHSKSSSRPQQIVVVRDASGEAAPGKPRVFVLAVGISEYANPKHNLDFAHADAGSFAAAWETQTGRLYSDVRTRVLTNGKATVSAIREGFDWLNANAGREDFAVIFFAAHGVGDASTGYYIASHDVDTARLMSTAIPDRDLVSLAEGLRCRRTLVFLDTCHAGGIEGARRNAPETLRELSSDEVGAVMFGACKPREESQEQHEWGHGAFTKALLETFGDPTKDLPPADGLLSMDEIVYAVGRRVPDLTGNEQHPVINRPPAIENFDFFAFKSAP